MWPPSCHVLPSPRAGVWPGGGVRSYRACRAAGRLRALRVEASRPLAPEALPAPLGTPPSGLCFRLLE